MGKEVRISKTFALIGGISMLVAGGGIDYLALHSMEIDGVSFGSIISLALGSYFATAGLMYTLSGATGYPGFVNGITSSTSNKITFK